VECIFCCEQSERPADTLLT